MDSRCTAAFGFAQYRVEATSPGEWGNGTRVTIRYRLRGTSGGPEVDIAVQAPYEPAEYFAGLAPDALESQINAPSLLIRLIPDGPPAQSCLLKPGPHHFEWERMLQGGTEGQPATPSKQDYLNAARKLGEEDTVASAQAPSLEVALVAVPGLYEDLTAQWRSRRSARYTHRPSRAIARSSGVSRCPDRSGKHR